MSVKTIIRDVKKYASVKIDASKYLFLAEIISRKFYRGKERIQDTEIYSVCCEELVRIAENFDPECGLFDRFAFRSLRNAAISYIRYSKRQKRAGKFEKLTDSQWEDVAEDKRDQVITIPDGLTDIFLEPHPDDTEQDCQDKKMLTEIYLIGTKIPVLAEKYGVSRVSIYNRVNRILVRLQERHDSLLKSLLM